MDFWLKFSDTKINLDGVLVPAFFFGLGLTIALLWSLHVIKGLDRDFKKGYNRIIDESIDFVSQVGTVTKLDVSEAIKMFEGLKRGKK